MIPFLDFVKSDTLKKSCNPGRYKDKQYYEAHLLVDIGGSMRINCRHVSASEAGEEYFQVFFAGQDEEEGPYLLIQRGFEYDDKKPPDLCYIETHDERFIGHFEGMKAVLSRNRFVLRLPPPRTETIDVRFTKPVENFGEIKRTLQIILGNGLSTVEDEDANRSVDNDNR